VKEMEEDDRKSNLIGVNKTVENSGILSVSKDY
jgi:hypothetical protein